VARRQSHKLNCWRRWKNRRPKPELTRSSGGIFIVATAPDDKGNKIELRNDKILSRGELKRQAETWHARGEKVTLANGCFDLLHVGHIRYLHAAKRLGGRLVVAINSDESVRALKGDGRPLMPAEERAEILAALSDVDAVIIFPERDVRALVREIRPDVQAKGTDYTAESVPERETVVECGGRVEIVGDPKDHSASEIIRNRLEQRRS
jgi:rfaE bifunctional protein nucleotidyltransferase chain/domain